MSGDGSNLRLLLIQLQLQTSDALLELAVLSGVDERVDAAVGERQCRAEIVQKTSIVDDASGHGDTEKHHGWCPAYNESTSDHQRSDHGIASCRVHRGTASGTHLNNIHYTLVSSPIIV